MAQILLPPPPHQTQSNSFNGLRLYRDWNQTKIIFKQKPQKLKLEDLNKSHNGRCTLLCGEKNFELCFLPSTTKNLYVFLTAHANCQYPIFVRTSWSSYLDGCVLYLDDLTRWELCQNNSYIGATFFYGTKTEDYTTCYIYPIIEKFLNLYTIDVKNLILISSSNGGFTALRLSCLFEGSTALVYNPQFSIKVYYNNQLTNAENVFDFQDIARTDLVHSLLTTSSKLFIVSNIASNSDKIQIDHLQKINNLNIHLGLNQITKNMYIYLLKCFSNNPHADQPDESMTLIFLEFLKNPEYYYNLLECTIKVFQRNLELYRKKIDQMNSYKFELFWNNCVYDVIKHLPADLYVQNLQNNLYYITFFIANFPKTVHYELILMRDSLFFSIHCHDKKQEVKSIVLEKFQIIQKMLAIGTGKDFIQNDGLMLNKEIPEYNITNIVIKYIQQTLPVLKEIDPQSFSKNDI